MQSEKFTSQKKKNSHWNFEKLYDFSILVNMKKEQFLKSNRKNTLLLKLLEKLILRNVNIISIELLSKILNTLIVHFTFVLFGYWHIILFKIIFRYQ